MQVELAAELKWLREKHPAGTISRPPPSALIFAIAELKASVFQVLPSPTPPKSVSLYSRSGIFGSAGLHCRQLLDGFPGRRRICGYAD